MKRQLISTLAGSLIVILAGCGGEKDTAQNPSQIIQTDGIPQGIYKTVACANPGDPGCETIAQELDLQAHNAVILKAPEDIGASPFYRYQGERVLLVPKEEKHITPTNMLAYGLYLYAQAMGDAWCGPCRMLAPQSYADAKDMLKNQFQITGTDAQNEAILQAFNANLELLGDAGLPLKAAIDADIKAMAESLVSLVAPGGDLPDLTALSPCQDEYPGGPCHGIPTGTVPKEKALSTPTDDFLRITKEEATQKAMEYRDKEGKEHSLDKVLNRLICHEDETKQIIMGGVYDSFNMNNPEPSSPRSALVSSYPSGFGVVNGYDTPASIHNPSIFSETMTSLPTNMTRGWFIVGLKEKGFSPTSGLTFYFDKYSIGSLFGASTDNYDGNVSTLRTSWPNTMPNIYYQDLSQMQTTSGQNLLSKINGGQNYLDISMMYTTNVDFVAVAACVPKDKPTAIPIPEIPTGVKCDPERGEQYVEVVGGTIDDFASPTDATTPSAALLALPNRHKYDDPIEKSGIFADTLAHPGDQITQLALLVNTRPSAAGSGDDKIYVGSYASTKFALANPNAAGIPTPNGGTAHIIYGSDAMYDSNGNNIGDIISWMNNTGNDLDIIVADQTEVDVTRLSMCVIPKDDKGDIGINKHILDQSRENGLLEVTYELSFTGTLPTGETISISDIVPSGATFTAVTSNGWNCNPNAPIYAGALTCTLTGLADPIPSIQIEMLSKSEKSVQNCARIERGVNTYYNSDPSNDESCVDTNVTDDTPPLGGCNQNIVIDLRPASTWVDANGNNPTEHNVFATYPPHPSWGGVIWDGSMNWFDFGSAGNTVHALTTDFCACGDATITIDELKSDNYSKVYLDTDPTPNSYTNPAYIASRSDGISQSTMASWGPSESGSLNVPFSGNSAVTHTLHFDVKNGFGPSGGAINGTISLRGHAGVCTPEDIPDTNTSDGGIDLTDHNITVEYGGTLTAVDNISVLLDPNRPGGGTVVIDLEGPIAVAGNGKPVIDDDPTIVTDLGDLANFDASIVAAVDHLINPPHYTRDPATQTVSDYQQNLMWQDDEEAKTVQKPWITLTNYNAGDFNNTSGDTAATYCQNLTLGGYTDWRLPTRDELLGIVDFTQTNPSIDTSVFSNTAHSRYWSYTTYIGNNYSNIAWYIHFNYGVSYGSNKNNSFYVRCVRDLP